MPLPAIAPLILRGLGSMVIPYLLSNLRNRSGNAAGGNTGGTGGGFARRWRRNQNQEPAPEPHPLPLPRPEPSAITLPLQSPTREQWLNSLVLSRPYVDQATQGTSDLVKGTLREVQKLTEESVARSGITGGYGSRLVADTLASQAPQLYQAAQATNMQGVQQALAEWALQNQLFGNIGGNPTMDAVNQLMQLAFGEAALTGVYNPFAQYGLFPVDPRQVQRQQTVARINQGVNNLMQIISFLRLLGFNFGGFGGGVGGGALTPIGPVRVGG